MKDQNHPSSGFYSADTCDLGAFIAILERETQETDVPSAADIQKNVPVYDASCIETVLEDEPRRRDLMTEWAQVLMSGAGIVAIRGAYSDTQVLDDATQVYRRIIAQEKDADGGGGDHFAASGANDRIWNALQKLCEHAPDVFLRYFANPAIAAICEAWLGPNYQMTAQVNLVHPGGAAQQAHRDYHLGFQTAELSARYPAHVHSLSPVLTLQGAVAHCDMPIDSGPTKLLPFSQSYVSGYAAWRRDDFQEVFEARCIQLPLQKGDAVFFNPALFHAAGANTSSDIHRMANLLQVSSAFGRAMETVDRRKMCKMLYPHAAQALGTGTLSRAELSAAIAATAEGYSFPTNLDRDPPKGGLAPETQQAFFLRALDDGIGSEAFGDHLDAMAASRSG
ncbi:phytanoyl-CoA dioxygenase family protein [Roseobacter sp. YSTF-M11]|uniref:Phytanoyl-CoA dioxygenase family protein n=1 Tax=Roseobacter insulae TaxID=2859783 RepID=A0A9X1FWX8_9RHOB|nr:phytanoyl-CoA dioxygenase family protein [Roseobacter insulae]MBW4709076.1 phytanoyl-CoA dioxygenase family protein [Roseobacter insulae]